jgi:hypothetical protein
MARLQTKHHGTVNEFKVRSKQEAYNVRDRMTENVRGLGYTLVGSAPGLTLFVCEKHNQGAPADQDFCYIISLPW